MTVSTTMSSTSVKPERFFMASPFPVAHAVQSGAVALRIDVVHVVSLLRRIGRARVGAQAPLLPGHRIGRDTAQEVQPGALRVALVYRAFDQFLERRRVAGLAKR